MDIVTLQKKHDRLVDAVHRMRGWQREYLKTHASSDLDKVKYYQHKVDNLITEEIKRRKSKQKELF